MGGQIMWSYVEQMYRGQGSGGTVVTIEEGAMQLALKRAGKGTFEVDWWLETLRQVLEHWGIQHKKWTDPATQVPRLHFSLSATHTQEEEPARAQTPESKIQTRPLPGPLSTRLLTNEQTKDRE